MEVPLISVNILLCRKAAHLLVIISMRLKIDQLMLMDSIDVMICTIYSGLDSGYNFYEIKTGMAMLSRLCQVYIRYSIRSGLALINLIEIMYSV